MDGPDRTMVLILLPTVEGASWDSPLQLYLVPRMVLSANSILPNSPARQGRTELPFRRLEWNGKYDFTIGESDKYLTTGKLILNSVNMSILHTLVLSIPLGTTL